MSGAVFPFSFLLHDSRLERPGPLDDSRSLVTGKHSEKVPVIRLYGYSSSLEVADLGGSRQCCVNVHGYFPKLFMDVVPELSIDELAELIDWRISGGSACVYNITILRRKNFYGYHETDTDIYAIELFRPIDVSRVAELVTTPETFRVPITVYEVHIPYLLQFLMEHQIQGVTAFGIDPNGIHLTSPKTTCMDIEISIKSKSILCIRKSSSQRGYPVPPPLTGEGNGDLVCEVLQSLWEEEFDRSLPGKFPYTPEGIADGIDRPDCSEMPWIRANEQRKQEWCAQLERQMPTQVDETQGLIEALVDIRRGGSQFDMSMGDEDSHIPELTATLVVERPREDSQISAPLAETVLEKPRNALVAAVHRTLPSTECRIRFSVNPPRGPIVGTLGDGRMSLTGATQITAPLRIMKPVPVSSQQSTRDELTFGTMAVIELETGEGGEITSIGCLLIDERESPHGRIVVVTQEIGSDDQNRPVDCEIVNCSSEVEMLDYMESKIFNQFDPAVVLSWDCSRHVLGYILTRAQGCRDDLNLSRCKESSSTSMSGGRLVTDLWRVLRNDAESGLKLGTTTLEGVAHSVLGITVPSIKSGLAALVRRVRVVFELADVTRVMPRATEMARLYGMDLESTFTRGSQFRVECMLVRASRKLGYVLPSSSKSQVRNQSAMEGIPMVLEPVSGLITDPVCVLDFQSLYPSLIIAYNMCYSTCLGRISDMRSVVQLGTQSGFHRTPTGGRASIVTPSETAFAERTNRLGLLPRICHEILQTRIMVKKSMKSGSKSPALLKQLDARQLSLKLLSNVIYGYTSASFSGRMPCPEIADSIVILGRTSLESAMRTAERLGGVVVYGDTDSLFVKLPGRSVPEAFEFGARLVQEVNSTHPWPMKLILEKVYSCCTLVTKKRYVGRAYDSVDAEPRIDAKGIETIRRDTCPAVAVTVERIITTMFAQAPELSGSFPAIQALLEQVCVKEFRRILRGELPSKFFVFQNQVRQIDSYKDMNHLPPAARVAVDTGRLDAARGERIAYVITQSSSATKLSDQVKPPSAIVTGTDTLNYDYYVTKQVIPAIQRIFGPLADRAFTWLSIARAGWSNVPSGRENQQCILCKATTASAMFSASKVPLICGWCSRTRLSQAIAEAKSRQRDSEARMTELMKLCCHCSGSRTLALCCKDAFHCEVYFQRSIANAHVKRTYSELDRLTVPF